jgi:hypothetical protein
VRKADQLFFYLFLFTVRTRPYGVPYLRRLRHRSTRNFLRSVRRDRLHRTRSLEDCYTIRRCNAFDEDDHVEHYEGNFEYSDDEDDEDKEHRMAEF